MTFKNGLYSIYTEMTEGGRGRADGINRCCRTDAWPAVDSHFYYTGTYTAGNGKWRGELTTKEHTKSVGELPLFGGREVTTRLHRQLCRRRIVTASGTALVGKTSVMLDVKLKFRSEL